MTAPDVGRMTPERLAEIQRLGADAAWGHLFRGMRELLTELDAVTRERDEARKVFLYAFGADVAEWTKTASVRELAAALLRSRDLWRDTASTLARELDEAISTSDALQMAANAAATVHEAMANRRRRLTEPTNAMVERAYAAWHAFEPTQADASGHGAMRAALAAALGQP